MTEENRELGELHLKHLGIDTQREHVLYMNADCPICKSEGFEAQARIRVEHRNGSLLASLNIFRNDFLAPNEVALSENAWRDLDAAEGDRVILSHPDPVESFGHVRSKIYGNELDQGAFEEILGDIVRNRYSDIQLSSFVTAFAGSTLSRDEIYYLTQAMVQTGKRLQWDREVVGDKHSLGGLPGNRTTPIVVSIVASQGVAVPKTSSRAITSPAGTADTMETITRVNLEPDEIRQVVDRENGCFVWGGTAELSPADDILIQVERSLDIDSEPQMVASIISKKLAAGSTHVVIDMPVGPTAKVRSQQAAEDLASTFEAIAHRTGLELLIVPGNGQQPIGRGIGPALEARDVLQVLREDSAAPESLRDRSLELAGHLLELTGATPQGQGEEQARRSLESGRAWEKFQAICHAQGRLSDPPQAEHTHPVRAERDGPVTAVDNRRLAKTAKLAGAPQDPAAGVDYRVRLGQLVESGDVLYRLHAESQGELDYALNYVNTVGEIVRVGDGE